MQSDGFSEVNAGRIDHNTENTLRFKNPDVSVVEDLRYIVSRGIVKTDVWQHERNFHWYSNSEVDQGKCTATIGQDRACPELYVASLKHVQRQATKSELVTTEFFAD